MKEYTNIKALEDVNALEAVEGLLTLVTLVILVTNLPFSHSPYLKDMSKTIIYILSGGPTISIPCSP
jgi:hypothetical protein